jgi:type IV pilus secretin PilQ/predicted competence protein
MSGRRSWGGYGLALGLVFFVTSCAERHATPPTPEASTASTATATESAVTAEPATPAPAPAEEAQAPDLRVKGIKLVEDEGQTGIFIKLSRVPDKIDQFTLAKPPRLVIDAHGPVAADMEAIERAAEGDPRVSRVRAARQDGRLRITVDLKERMKYTVNDLKTMVVAFLGERSGAAGPTKSQVLYAEAGEAPTGAVASGGPRVEMAAVEPPTEERVRESSGRPAAKIYTGQKISLDFKDADILNVLRILSEVGGENIVATDDVKGRITVRLVDVPWDQALDIVLTANRLDSVKVGNVRRVSSVTRLKEEREAQLAAEQAAKELEPLKTAYIHVNYMKVTGKEILPQIQGSGTIGQQEVCRNQATQGQGDQGDKITSMIQDVLSERGKVKVDARSNTIIVRDIQRGIDAARDLIAKLDISTPQVLIESNIVEATNTFARDLGIQWGYQAAYAPQFGNATGKEFPSSVVLGGNSLGPNGLSTGLAPGSGTGGAASGADGTSSGATLGPFGVPAVPVPFIADFPANRVGTGNGSTFDLALGSIDGSKQLDARITALEEQGEAKVISRPKVTTANNQNACIASVIIQRVRLPSAGTIIGAGGGAQAVAFQEFTTGIILQVVPQVSADGYVLMQLKVISSTPGPATPPDNIPATIDREASTTVLIKGGETLVMGGVYRDASHDDENGIPWLRSIPGLSWIFKHTFRDNTREELLIFLTPRVVQGGGTRILPTAKQLWEHRPEPVEVPPSQSWKK